MRKNPTARIPYLASRIAAANSNPLAAIAEPVPAANARIIEGRMSIPYGLWPVEIVNEKGEKEKVLQRLDKAVAGRLVAAFNSFLGRVARLVSGCPIYQNHPDVVTGATNAAVPSAAAWARLGKCVGMEAGGEALTIQGDFTDQGKALLAANEALAPSPHWALKRTGQKQDELEICEPAALYSVGLTSRPNIAGAAVNQDVQDAEAEALAADAERRQALAVLAAEIAGLETRLQAAEAARYAQEQAVLARDASLQEVKAQCAALRAELEAARKQLEAQTAAAANELAAANARLGALAGAVLEGAVAGGLILAADREAWREKLAQTPAAANDLLAFERILKTRSIVDPARIAAANADLGGVSAAAKFEGLVRERMAKTGEAWPAAWNACAAAHAEIFKLMPNGGRA